MSLLNRLESKLLEEITDKTPIPSCDKCIYGLIYNSGSYEPAECSCGAAGHRTKIFKETNSRMEAIIDYLVKIGLNAEI